MTKKLFFIFLLIIGMNSCSKSQIFIFPTKELQITYIQSDKNNIDQLYAIKIDCLTKKICLNEPKLIFDTQSISNSDGGSPSRRFSRYAWSPKSNSVALSFGGDIFIGRFNDDLNYYEWTNITNSKGVIENDLAWSSNEKLIFYIACSYELYNGCRLFQYDIERSEATLLLNKKMDTSIDSYNISPNGQELIVDFSKNDENGYSQLYKSNLDGSNTQQITFGEANNSSPSYSSNNQKIVFVSESDIIIKDVYSGIERNLTEDFSREANSPVFLSDDWIVFYSFNPDLSSNIFAVSLDGKIFQITSGDNQKVLPSWRYVGN